MVQDILSTIMILVTIIGVYLIIVQIKQSRKDAIASSLITMVSEHWLSWEERAMNLRTRKEKVWIPKLIPILMEKVEADYCGDLSKLAIDYLDETQVKPLIGDENVIEAITQEFFLQDIMLNLDEEEYFIAKEFELVNDNIWDWWEFYIKEDFERPMRRKYWELRKQVTVTHPKFREFVDNICLEKSKIKLNE